MVVSRWDFQLPKPSVWYEPEILLAWAEMHWKKCLMGSCAGPEPGALRRALQRKRTPSNQDQGERIKNKIIENKTQNQKTQPCKNKTK